MRGGRLKVASKKCLQELKFKKLLTYARPLFRRVYVCVCVCKGMIFRANSKGGCCVAVMFARPSRRYVLFNIIVCFSVHAVFAPPPGRFHFRVA